MSKSKDLFQQHRDGHIEQRAQPLSFTAEDIWLSEMRDWLETQGITIPLHHTVSEFLQGEYAHPHDTKALVNQFNNINNIQL